MNQTELEAALEAHHLDGYGWALTCCNRNTEDAEDALQASYLKILEGRARFGGRSSFKTWLFGVIRRTAAEHRRRRALHRVTGQPSDATATADTPDVVDRLVRSERTHRLRTALALLPERQRYVLHLVFYQDLSVREAADVMGVSVGTARTHYHRGKSRLKSLLTETCPR